MSLAKVVQDAWNKQSPWLIVLRPLSWLYHFGFEVNRQLYQHGLKKTYQAPIPVMVIGNITVGGSGKTPLLIELVRYLQQHQVKVGVISRGYGAKGPFPALVDAQSSPEQAGDEPSLIVQSTQVPMAVGSNRQQTIDLLLKHYSLDLIISDDGLQHWALSRQIEWIVLDMNRGLGNEKLLPEGYLREPKTRLSHSTVIEHSSQPRTDLSMHLKPGKPYNLVSRDTEQFNAKQAFHAIVGIGFPQRFYMTLHEIGVTEFEPHEFIDHYDYQLSDVQFDDDCPIITTEKDAVKLVALMKNNPQFQAEIWVVPVKAKLSTPCYTLLQQQLQQLGISCH